MKKIAVLTATLLLMSPALAQVAPTGIEAKNNAPSLPLVPAGEELPEISNPSDITTPTDQQKWGSLDDNSRYLLIMGTADGFAAAGDNAPCFPGKDNLGLDADLKAAGFGDKSHVGLADELSKLSAPSAQCAMNKKRGYDAGLLKSMPDTHLALYLTGAVRGYAKLKDCEASNHPYAAATATAALLTELESELPSDILSKAFAEGCAGPPKE